MNQKKELPHLIMEIFPRFMHLLRNEMRGIDTPELSMPQMATMGAISRGLDTVGKLSLHHGVSQPAVSRLIDGLVRRGFIERVSGEEDRRQIRLKLTAKGRNLSDRAHERIHARIAERLSHLNDEEQRSLAAGVSLLGRVL